MKSLKMQSRRTFGEPHPRDSAWSQCCSCWRRGVGIVSKIFSRFYERDFDAHSYIVGQSQSWSNPIAEAQPDVSFRSTTDQEKYRRKNGWTNLMNSEFVEAGKSIIGRNRNGMRLQTKMSLRYTSGWPKNRSVLPSESSHYQTKTSSRNVRGLVYLCLSHNLRAVVDR